jgi:hypothetical protein
MFIADDRFPTDHNTEVYNSSYMDNLEENPLAGVDHLGAGLVVVINRPLEGDGMTYEQCVPAGRSWHRTRAYPPTPNQVRPA